MRFGIANELLAREWREEIENKLYLFKEYAMTFSSTKNGHLAVITEPVYICSYTKFLNEIAKQKETLLWLINENIISIFPKSNGKNMVMYKKSIIF